MPNRKPFIMKPEIVPFLVAFDNLNTGRDVKRKAKGLQTMSDNELRNLWKAYFKAC